jgi:phage terminase large subunit-like protein
VTPTVEQRLGDAKTETLVLDVVKVNAADVYDITVEGDAPEFYAGSGQLLVHNCKWKYPKQSWDAGIMPSLRADLVGDHPRAFVTTTPKPINLLQEWVKRNDSTIHVIRGSTFDNSSNLSQLVIQELRKRYEGTAVGRQELYGEIIEAFEGALFSRLDIENNRVDTVPDNIISIVVGVDPSLTGEDDEMGIVVVARDRDNHLYVLADRSIMGVGRSAALEAWRVVADWGANELICEVTIGKRWMQQVFHDAYYELVKQGVFPENTRPPIKGVDSKIGKKLRAEPIGMRCEQGRFHHVGVFERLEDQMVTFTGWGNEESPDRLDAMVHAARYLIEGEKKQARISSPQDVLSTTLQSLWAEAGSYRVDF